jgi:hypothetical protein
MVVRSPIRGGAARVACAIVESLESRQFLSAADVWAALRPLPAWPAGHREHAVHAKLKVGALKKVNTTQLGPDLIGTWTGTFTSNTTRATSPGSINFTSRHKDSTTGVFDTTSIGGSQVLSTVTVGKNRVFLCVLKSAPKEQVSLAGNVTSDHKAIIGRWSVQNNKGFTTGVFRFERVV